MNVKIFHCTIFPNSLYWSIIKFCFERQLNRINNIDNKSANSK